ncbi:cobyrinate a,c-diamide synthase [Megalodesulfovibrio gigas]|nr:cobyrinate a,c-diamide synthase [Megalodesulfovibrio gigas]
MIAGLSGGAGKTLVSLGLCRAWTRAGLTVRPFKKGPDYIDAGWLGLATGLPPTNLDPFFLSPEQLQALFQYRLQEGELAVVEGNRGLFDGHDVEGACASSRLARTLDCPVVLVIDATKMTRTIAAIIQGVQRFEEGMQLAGVICNRTAGDRHRDSLRQAIEQYTDVPIMGMLPKIKQNPIPERHMGLMSMREQEGAEAALDAIADIIERHLDLDRLRTVAQEASAWHPVPELVWPGDRGPGERPVARIGYVRDAALWFYYEENLEALRRAGAKLVPLSLLDPAPWPEIHGLYLGGGFPEALAEQLAANAPVRQRVRMLAEMGVPIFAECGGFMYLANSLRINGKDYPMAGVFPVHTELSSHPVGLGYVQAEVVAENPFLPLGTTFHGHEFHYSRCVAADGAVLTLGLRLHKGEGMLAGYDGLLYKNVMASYTHTHALALPDWAPRFVQAAMATRRLAG